MTIDELRDRRDSLRAELDELRQRPASDGNAERQRNLDRGLARAESELADAEKRLQHVADLARDPRHHDVHHERTKMSTTTRVTDSPGSEARQKAQRAIDKAYESGVLPEAAGFRLTDLIERDRFGLDARYIAAVASPAYERAFAKKLSGVNGAEDVLSADETEAMLAVGRSMSERALAVGEGKTGGFAVPLTLDPSVLLSGDGAVNPIRELATVTAITTTKWAGVSSAGVEAKFAAEATEAEDGSPELAQPEITPEKATIWVPYSIESGQDWPGLSAELGKLFADAKSVKEAEVFATGKGSEHIPQGLVTGATELVETATKETTAVGDVYGLQEALPARWQPRATWLSSLTVANRIARFVGGGSEEPVLFTADRAHLLGKPWAEVSTMSTKLSTKKEKILAYGDIGAAFRIVDRIGMQVEPVPIVMKEGVPTGQRGLYCYFRVGSKVIIPEAVRLLMVKE